MRFTANLTVASKAEWQRQRKIQPWLPAKPAPNVLYGSSAWQKRIGQLLPSGEDIWWDVPANTQDTRILAALVAGAIQEDVLPAVEEQLSRNG
ncbi:MAG: hypothetical protein ABJC24_03280 [Chloroflexota bacterium]